MGGSLLGQTLSHYRITAQIGAGGMGEVYRATDTSLGRDVALKMLPRELASDPDRLARFEREAKLLASLNHPSIALLYAFEQVAVPATSEPAATDGSCVHLLVMELVEGLDLRQRLDRGPIPVDEALEIALQVAEALEEAHGKGIVHRDLKPANVKLTTDGKVKVLDFGLAKAWAGDGDGSGTSSSALSQSPTLAHTGTIAGVILGTAAYMSPEQARGKAVDKRSDVWSFGVLLWEMLTGRVLFAGDTVTDVIAAVVKEEPDLQALPASTPPPIRRLIARCLRKDPRQRLPDIGGARLELQEGLSGRWADEPTGRPGDERRGRERLAWAALALAGFGLAAGLAWRGRTARSELPRVTRFAAALPKGRSIGEIVWPVPSPDGTQVAFVAHSVDPTSGGTGPAMIWLRRLDSLEARPLPQTESAPPGVPFWSPDGRSLGFVAAGELRTLDLADATVRKVCTLPANSGFVANWSPLGTIVFSGGEPSRLYRVPASGGEPKVLTAVDDKRGELGHHMPQFLPDGRRFLFAIHARSSESQGLFVASLDDPAARIRIAPDFLHYEYAAGYLLFGRDGTLYARRFDPDRPTESAEPSAIASVAGATPFPMVGRFGSAPQMLATYSGEVARGPAQLTWLDRKGAKLGTVGPPGNYGQIALSPDGRNVVLEIAADRALVQDLWLMDLARGVTTRLTNAGHLTFDPVWSPDGRSIVFGTEVDGKVAVRRKGLRASDPETVVVDTKDNDYPECWIPDGSTLLFLRLDVATNEKTAWAVPIAGGQPEPALRTAAKRVDEPQVSPDGRWIAYMSDESGSYEVYVEPFRREGERVRVSVDGGGQPKWRGDGLELFYATPSGDLMSVAIKPLGDRLDVSLPVKLFRAATISPTGEYDDYAVTRDGQRFLVKQSSGADEALSLQVITNWTALLEKK